MNAWILYIWIGSSNVAFTLNVVDQIETKEACEILLNEIRQSQPAHFTVRGGACKQYRIVQKQ
jgi:hypothetical protein